MSAKGHFRTHAPQQILFDHLVGGHKQRGGHGETKRLRRLEIDGQSEFGGLKDWNISLFGAFQDLVSHIGDAVSGRQSATCLASRSKGARAVT